MKKIILTIVSLLSIILLMSCKPFKEENTVTILVPNGSPALSQMYIEEKKSEYNYKIDLAQGADSLSAAFISKSYDFIYAPLNIGAKMYINNQNYKLLATVVDCNYYFVMKSNSSFNLQDIQNKKIVIFGQTAMSGIISRYILSSNNLDLENLRIEYVNSVQDALSAFIVDNDICVLLSEPQISTLESRVEGIKLFSLKEEYERITGKSNIPQAAVFVRSDLEKEIVERYSKYLEESIKKVNSNVKGSAKLGATLYSLFKEEDLIKAIPRSEIKFTKAQDSKEKCEDFFNFLNEYNSQFLGGDVDEQFYYN